MKETSALAAIRRRWWVVVLLALLGATLGALPEPARVEEQSKLIRYQATHTLLLNNTDSLNSSGATAVSPNQVALLATTGEVPKRVAERIGFQGNSAELASQVEVEFDFVTTALTVTTTQDSAARAEEIANAFADTLNSYLAERQDVVYQERLAAGITRLAKLETQLDALTDDLAADPSDPVLASQQDAISRQYSVAFEQDQVLSEAPLALSFTTLQRAEAFALDSSSGGLSAPRSRTTRGLLGLAAGLALGIGVAIVMGLLDRKIRSREQAELVLGLRTRVVVPRVKPDRRGLVVRNGRHDALSDSYRTLRNVIGFIHGGLEPVDRARVTLVVSPGPGEGKTSLAANLAAAFVENGQDTIVVNTDFRRPRLAGMVTDGPLVMLPFVLEDLETVEPKWLLAETVDPHLQLLDLSTLSGSAGELVRAAAHLVPQLTRETDAIVVDTSPVGATAEVLDMVPLADVIVVVVRLGQTSISVAERTVEILRDVSTAPMVLVLSGVKQERMGYYEYADRRSPAPGELSDERDGLRPVKRARREKVG